MRAFTYTRAGSPEEAVQAVASGGNGTRFLAGGTTLYDLMSSTSRRPRASLT